ncbi:MAG TPA: cupin domain-containing protein [Gemmataceae bacterium]|nr:cupin domain-containing protein [Gemmataceae bacterium]
MTMIHTHLYHLEASSPKTFSGGVLRGASADEFPILKGLNASMYSVHLEEAGVREPHWHPDAWEFTYCVTGRGHVAILSPKRSADTFEIKAGDVFFVPPGHLHYFENLGPGELHLVLAFNTSEAEGYDDIGIGESMGAIPDEALAAIFGVSPEVIRALPDLKKRVIISSKKVIPSPR